MKQKLSIKEWSRDERPREKLMEKGADVLSNSELLAIIISSGTKEESALDISRNILNHCNNNLRELSCFSYERLTRYRGVGNSKAIKLIAMFELSRRIMLTKSKKITSIRSSQYAASLISPILRDLAHEECWVLYLNRANKLISRERLSIGGVSSTIVDIKIVVKNALEKLASSIILVHNHPSGNLEPGNCDVIQTQVLIEAASLFDIKVLDHLIIAGDSYFSFADEGII